MTLMGFVFNILPGIRVVFTSARATAEIAQEGAAVHEDTFSVLQGIIVFSFAVDLLIKGAPVVKSAVKLVRRYWKGRPGAAQPPLRLGPDAVAADFVRLHGQDRQRSRALNALRTAMR